MRILAVAILLTVAAPALAAEPAAGVVTVRVAPWADVRVDGKRVALRVGRTESRPNVQRLDYVNDGVRARRARDLKPCERPFVCDARAK